MFELQIIAAAAIVAAASAVLAAVRSDRQRELNDSANRQELAAYVSGYRVGLQETASH